MTEPLRFHLQVAPNSVKVRPASPRVALQPPPFARVLVAAVPGRRGAQGPPGEGSPTFGEIPTGAKNGINTVFTTAAEFRTGTTTVYLNGIREFHYVETDVDAITFTDPPLSSDDIHIDYIVAN